MNKAIPLLSVLSDPTRFKALHLLWGGQELCVCALMQILAKSQSCMSRHMAALKKAGLVVDRRDAQWTRYRRNPRLSRSAIALIEAAFRLEAQSKGKNA